MIGYFTFVALLNLGLGYALAMYVQGGERRTLRQFISDIRTGRTKEPDAAHEPVETVARGDRPQTSAEEQTTFERDESLEAPAATPGQPKPVATAAPVRAPISGLVTLDYVDQLLTEVTAAGEMAGTPTSVVLLELDAIDGDSDVASDRLLAGIAETVNGLLDDAHTAARFADQRFFLLLPGDDESLAIKRAEEVRQRIEATEFVADDRRIHATVTCALAQVSTDTTTGQIMDALQSALVKAKRLGGNRTYMFDGVTPSPVVPPELNLAPQKCAI